MNIGKSCEFLDQRWALLILNQSQLIKHRADIKYCCLLTSLLYLWQQRSIQRMSHKTCKLASNAIITSFYLLYTKLKLMSGLSIYWWFELLLETFETYCWFFKISPPSLWFCDRFPFLASPFKDCMSKFTVRSGVDNKQSLDKHRKPLENDVRCAGVKQSIVPCNSPDQQLTPLTLNLTLPPDSPLHYTQ